MVRTWSQTRAYLRARAEQGRARRRLKQLTPPLSHARSWLLHYVDHSPSPIIVAQGITILLENGAAPEAIVEAIETYGYHLGTRKIRLAQIKHNEELATAEYASGKRRRWR